MEEKTDYIEHLEYLNNNLFRMMLLYFSKAFFDAHEFNVFKEKIENPSLLNMTVLITEDLIINYEIQPMDYFKLHKKRTILESNTFYLINLKTKSNPLSFNYLIDKYVNQLNNFTIITEILLEKYETHCKIKSSDLESYLKLQENIFHEHQQEINNKFFPPKFNLDLSKFTFPPKRPKPRLKDLIIKGNPEVIEKIIVDNFKSSNNVTIHRMFIALEKLGYIKIEYGSRNHIIECLNNSIGSIRFKSKSVFAHEIDFMSDKKYLKTRNQIQSLIENIS